MNRREEIKQLLSLAERGLAAGVGHLPVVPRHPLHVFGLGSAGLQAIAQFRKKDALIRCTYINTPEEIFLDPQPAAITVAFAEAAVLDPKYFFSKEEKTILIAGLGGRTGTRLIKDLSLFLRHEGFDFLAIASLPFCWEGKQRVAAAERVRKELIGMREFRYFDLNKTDSGKKAVTLRQAFAQADEMFLRLAKAHPPPEG